GRYTELRLALRRDGGASLGLTETDCRGERCERSREVAITWSDRPEQAAAAELLIASDSAHASMDLFDVSASAVVASVLEAPVPSRNDAVERVWVTGVVRDTRGRPLADIEVAPVDARVDASVRTDSAGRFTLGLPADRAGLIVVARGVGYAAAYRTVDPARHTILAWDPQLRSVQQLATKIIRASGLPSVLNSWQYDNFLARREKGVGKFLVGEEIWSSTSVGEALNRVPGVNVRIASANRIDRLTELRCNSGGMSGQIGVYVNGFERTSLPGIANSSERGRPGQGPAELTLQEFLVADVVGLEIYRGITEIPADFANPAYCAVIAVWTR
ncbi:MAG: carboxypeptidase-like regulatory domain-containing protein, partial [Gemmatimonadaceae bacterium]|nr:carboxypeptidase-like regulatory domain-containing protein [Gemmatimonadaceae bacterium]